ncbi:MAG: hypothetical protein R3362_05045 [Rhodothermales bacterium]|nr:hypothetical protein [Rhodothermales bacterium]
MPNNPPSSRLAFAYAGLIIALCTSGCDWATTTEKSNASQSIAHHSHAEHYSSVVRLHRSQDPATPVVPGAKATLLTNRNGARMTFHTNGLEPGHVYTVWWAIINAPDNCATSPCTAADIFFNTAAVEADLTYAAGHLVGGSGKGHFAGHVSAGELPGSWYSNGFTNPQGAEIHLILNHHGPAIPGQVANQTSTYRGGCTDESLPPPVPETARADGIPGPNTCELFQFAIFEQP